MVNLGSFDVIWIHFHGNCCQVVGNSRQTEEDGISRWKRRKIVARFLIVKTALLVDNPGRSRLLPTFGFDCSQSVHDLGEMQILQCLC